MSDYCVLCWSEKRQKTFAVTEVNEEPMCTMHAKLAGWQEPDKAVVSEQQLCHCGKTKKHSGRHRGSQPANKKPVDLPPVVVELLPTTLSGFEKAIQADRVTITVTAVQLDAFWNRLSLPEKARIVESLL